MLYDIATKCGLLGQAKQDITVNYDLALTLKVGVIPITITLPEKASFPCPVDVSVGGMFFMHGLYGYLANDGVFLEWSTPHQWQ
jgi:hypothetical protein